MIDTKYTDSRMGWISGPMGSEEGILQSIKCTVVRMYYRCPRCISITKDMMSTLPSGAS